MFITKGTKIQTIKPFGNGILKDGEIFEVTNLSKNGVITFETKFDDRFIITMDIFLEYFKVYEEKKVEKPKRTWTDWAYDWYYYFTLGGEEYSVPIKYRHNGKVVDFRTNYKDKQNVKVQAYCNLKHNDKFDLEKGLSLADAKMTIKLLQLDLEELIDNL